MPPDSPARNSRRGGRAELRAKRRKRARRVQAIGLISTLGAMIIVRALFFQAYFIPSPSMEATLLIGDRVLVNKMSYRVGDVQRGQVVVFNGANSFEPESTIHGGPLDKVLGLIGAAPSEEDFVKRVIGLPGDRIICCDTRGRISINGIVLDEPYLYPGDVPSKDRFNVLVPPGRLWVMGDHRSRSADSRAHLGDPGGGTVPIEKVIGRAVAIVWPLSHARRLPVPDTFDRITNGRTPR